MQINYLYFYSIKTRRYKAHNIKKYLFQLNILLYLKTLDS